MSYRIFGIDIERKTDILAFAAFVISIGGLITQTVNLVKGPDVKLEAPKQVLLTSQLYPDGKHYIRIAAKLIYLNKGSPGYDDITKSEEAYFSVNNRRIKLSGQEYIASGVENKQLVVQKKSDADPVQIKSGSVVVHETYFAPWPSKGSDVSSNFIEFSEFVNCLRKQPELNIEFVVKTFNCGTINKVNCRLLTKHFVQHLESKKWSAPVCQ